MAINQNHLFEELNGIKCAIVEKNASPERVAFLKKLLETNHFEVVVIPSPPPKAAPVPVTKPVAVADENTAPSNVAETNPQSEIRNPESYTIGVTDVTFNPTNAIFGRLLRTEDGHVITLAYWQQKDSIALDDIPYYENGKTRP